jgi:hypothetical protein
VEIDVYDTRLVRQLIEKAVGGTEWAIVVAHERPPDEVHNEDTLGDRETAAGEAGGIVEGAK